jgi:hypothetical protein
VLYLWEFIAWYCSENLSLATLAKRTGIAVGYASQLARDYGIPCAAGKTTASVSIAS